MSARTTRRALVVIAALGIALSACGSGGGSGRGDDGNQPDRTTSTKPADTSTANAESTTSAPPADVDAPTALRERLAEELDDEDLAAEVVAGLSPDVIANLEAVTGGDIAGSPKLDYDPTTVAPDEVDSLWVFAYGFRIASGPQVDGVGIGETPPPMDQLTPGPTNEELARLAADFVEEHPVPIVAQWEVAQVLEELGVEDVISVEPDVAEDGTVTYLSTDGVAQKGLRLAAEQDIAVGHAGVLCQADHAVRCLMTARDNGMEADVPEGVDLPAGYDPESGQTWTRERATWIPVDLLGRSILG